MSVVKKKRNLPEDLAKVPCLASDLSLWNTGPWSLACEILLTEGVCGVFLSCCCGSVAQSCSTRCDPVDCSGQASLSLRIPLSLLKVMSTESVMPSSHLSSAFPFSHPQSFHFLFYKISTSVDSATINASVTAVLLETSFPHGAHNSLLIPQVLLFLKASSLTVICSQSTCCLREEFFNQHQCLWFQIYITDLIRSPRL